MGAGESLRQSMASNSPTETLKTLSIRQPWAWLIAHGYKDVENRSWPTKVRGEFLIHAGLSFDKEGYAWVHNAFPKIPMPLPSEFERGGIVGRAELMDCIAPGSEQAKGLMSQWYFGDYAFLVPHAKPIPFLQKKGKLGFFETTIRAQEEAETPLP